MCFDDGDDDKETAQEGQDRADVEREAQEAAQRVVDQRNAEAARKARAQAEALSGAERRAAEAALDSGDVIEDDEDPLKPKKKGKGVSSLRINKASSLGGAPVGSGLTVG